MDNPFSHLAELSALTAWALVGRKAVWIWDYLCICAKEYTVIFEYLLCLRTSQSWITSRRGAKNSSGVDRSCRTEKCTCPAARRGSCQVGHLLDLWFRQK